MDTEWDKRLNERRAEKEKQKMKGERERKRNREREREIERQRQRKRNRERTDREKGKERKRKRRKVYCYSGITVLACTTNVHWAVYGATRYPLSPSALGCPWRPVLSQHPLPPLVTQSLQIHNL